MQDAMQKGLDTQAASLTESNAALAQLIAQLEQLGAGSPTQQFQGTVYPVYQRTPCFQKSLGVCAHLSAYKG